MYFRTALLCCALLLSACKKDIAYPDTQIIGHAAVGLNNPYSVYHDNSAEAIEMALETLGCDGVEIDIQLSASGKLWCFHDPYLDAQTGASGCIASATDEKLEGTRYKSIHKERLLALNQLNLERCYGKTLMLDLRHYDYCSSQVVNIQPFIDELSAVPPFMDGSVAVMVLLSNAEWAADFQTLPFPVIYSAVSFEDASDVMGAYPFDGVIIRSSEISAGQVSQLKAAGKKVIIFEVRSPKGIRNAFRKHPDYLVTDDLTATIIEKY